MLGLYVSSHPLFGVESMLRRHAECTIAELRECRDGDTKWVGGVVTALQRKYTKRGDLMAVFTLEDLQSAIEVMVFPRTMLEHGAMLADDAIVCVKGRIDLREEPAKIICLELKRPDLIPEGTGPRPHQALARVPHPSSCSTGSSRCCATTPATSPSTSISTAPSCACRTSSGSTRERVWCPNCGSYWGRMDW